MFSAPGGLILWVYVYNEMKYNAIAFPCRTVAPGVSKESQEKRARQSHLNIV